jgi:hypothetical protein
MKAGFDSSLQIAHFVRFNLFEPQGSFAVGIWPKSFESSEVIRKYLVNLPGAGRILSTSDFVKLFATCVL